jgi:electron transfer flavoprotein beta subunit
MGSGADQAIHLITDKDQDLCDPFTTASRLSKIFKRMGFNLILCGNMSLDNCAAQVHAFLAELLCIPRVTEVVKLKFVSKDRVRLWRRLEKGRRQVLECSLPALFTIDPLAGYPRYVSEFNLMGAEKMQIQRFTLADIGLAQTDPDPQAATVQVVGLSPAKPRTKKIFIPDSRMSTAQRMNSFLSGRGNSETKQSNLLVGTADYLSSQIIEYLTKEGITHI